MEASLAFLLRCILFIVLSCSAVASHAQSLKRAAIAGKPFSLAIPSDYIQQQKNGLDVAFSNEKNFCAISMLMGKSKIDRDLWKEIYKTRDSLNSYNNKFADRLAMVPANIVSDSEIKTQKGEPLKVYFSTQLIGKENTDIWETLYTAEDNFSINFVQCPKGIMKDADALAILATVQSENVSPLHEDIAQLPFLFKLKLPYYASSIQYPSWQSVQVNLNQNIGQITRWADTQALISYEKGPYSDMDEAINQSRNTQVLKLGTTKIVMQNNNSIAGQDARFYLIAALDGDKKTGILLYLLRSSSGELITVKATTTSDKVQNFYEPISDMTRSIRFSSEMTEASAKHYLESEPVAINAKSTALHEGTIAQDETVPTKKAVWRYHTAH